MSLFSRQLYAVNESYGSINDVANEVVTESDVYDAMLECNDNLNRINSALQITDVMMEAGLTPVTEANVKATLTNAKNKAVTFFKDLWAKIKAWFQNVWANLKEMLTGQKKFADKYGAAVLKKASTMQSVDMPTYVDYSNTKVDKFSAFATAINKAAASKVEGTGSEDVSKSDITEEIVKAGCSALGYTNLGSMPELKKKLKEDHVQTKKNYTVSKSDITTMLGFLKEGAKDGEQVNKLFAITHQTFTEAIKTVQSAEDAGKITYTNKSFNTAVSAIQGIASYCASLVTARNNYAFRFLKSFLRSKKFNTEATPNMAGLTIESAFDTIFDTL